MKCMPISNGNDYFSLPENNEIEVSVFGNGCGECVVIHLSNNEWIIVDSFCNSNKYPIALQYLNDLSVNISQDVKKIIASHWHDDHVRGLSQIVDECKEAKFVASQACGVKEFLKLCRIYDKNVQQASPSGVCELSKIFKILLNNNRIPQRAVADRHLLQTNNVNIIALSPSDYTVESFLQQVACNLPKEGESQTNILRFTNDPCVVLWIEIDDIKILLGSDLEFTLSSEAGWDNILNNLNVNLTNKADIYKIPHHGSITADKEQLWDKLISNDAITVMSPFKKGNVFLPGTIDVERILKKERESYISLSHKQLNKKVKRDNKIDRLIKEHIEFITPMNNVVGQVRIRKKLGKKPVISLFKDAAKLECFYDDNKAI